MKSLSSLTLREALDGITKKEFTSSEVLTDVLHQIQEKNKTINAFLSYAKNTSDVTQSGLLQGLPIAVKDNFLTKSFKTTASATILKDFSPPYESTVTQRLTKQGAVIIGKTNLDAWAHGSSTETSQFGRTLNPRNIAHLPGGSSGGSAAAVAADMCIAAIGSETAGSIRQPSAWCGTVGLKPTYGRVSRYGVVAMGSSLDSPGPMTKTVEDAALLLSIIAGKDVYDGTTSDQQVPDYTSALKKDIKGMKIGVLYLNHPGLSAVRSLFEQQIKVLQSLGAHVELADAMNPEYAIAAYTVIQRAEVSSNLARYDGIRYGLDRSHFGDEAKRRIMLGTYTLSKGYADKYYILAEKVRTLFHQDFERLFKKYDVLISLSSPGFAKKIGATEGEVMFGELEDMLLEPTSITGLPGLNVPCYHDEKTNLYLGMNIMAPMWREDLAITVGHVYESATEWNSWRKH